MKNAGATPQELPLVDEVLESEPLADGSRFEAYVIESCIGEGGTARIYRCEHDGLRRLAALKLPLRLGHALERERFLREARILAAIKHPNVVNILDVGMRDERPYLVIELLEGRDLEQHLELHGALDESVLIDLIVPIVAALVVVHDTGVVHGDVKPGNIFLSRGRNDEIEPKLLDFGASVALGFAPTAAFRRTGTPFYMSPEALMEQPLTPRSDQYSLGVVLYECLTGVNPFLDDTVHRITTGSFVTASQLHPQVSRRLARIIDRCMSRDPEERYPDMRQLGGELMLLAGHRTRITWGLSFSPPKVVAPRRRWLIVALLFALAGGSLLAWRYAGRPAASEAGKR